MKVMAPHIRIPDIKINILQLTSNEDLSMKWIFIIPGPGNQFSFILHNDPLPADET